MHVSLDPAASGDVPELVRLRRAAEDWLAERGIDQWRPGSVTEQTVARQVALGEWHVVRTGPRLVAALRLLWTDPDVWQHEDGFAAYVHGLVVDRACSGRALGAGMLDRVEQTAAEAGARLLRLDCAESNPALRRYYQRLGFREVGRRDGPQPWLDTVLLEREVRPAPRP